MKNALEMQDAVNHPREQPRPDESLVAKNIMAFAQGR